MAATRGWMILEVQVVPKSGEGFWKQSNNILYYCNYFNSFLSCMSLCVHVQGPQNTELQVVVNGWETQLWPIPRVAGTLHCWAIHHSTCCQGQNRCFQGSKQLASLKAMAVLIQIRFSIATAVCMLPVVKVTFEHSRASSWQESWPLKPWQLTMQYLNINGLNGLNIFFTWDLKLLLFFSISHRPVVTGMVSTSELHSFPALYLWFKSHYKLF